MLVRPAEPKDVSRIFDLIKELALYEKAPEQVTNTVEILHHDLFVDTICEAIVAVEKGTVHGFALFYTSYSTWKGRSLYLEDFYVIEDQRKRGIGQLLFDDVLRIAKERKVARMDWQVLEWNQLALNFYAKNNAMLDYEWVNGRFIFEL
ncbi:GNAT family N-acetyltransferase [Crocinitomicaceae bacterium]|jgi:GNAT superfamily N-acetyltransferase|nr:GNAT family N-acetyltransferase [Crocinitomicaceae bacterium]MDG1347830.1 GNAT family N-acetyltransferase [Crocinitomicaceae bacterium]MDG2465179.1 GNAT family N-acetyltransferase [Crocinitomicaceae bacterium]